MGVFDKILNNFGYLKKSDIKPTQIIRVPEIKSTSYAPTKDKLLDILQFYKSKYENYSWAELAKNTTIVRSIHNKINLDVFKEGFLVNPKYTKKCKSCGEEYNTDIDECNVCGSNEFKVPNDKNQELLENFIDSANVNSDSLKKELKSLTLDVLRYDEGYLQKIYDIDIDFENSSLKKEFKHIQRVVPINIFAVMSDVGVLGVDNNTPLGFCPYHRDAGTFDLNQKVNCPLCKKEFGLNIPLYTADYYTQYGEGNKIRIYYNRSEIIRFGLFEQSSRYSMMATIADKTTSLLAIDSLINDVYVGRKVPNRAVFFNTSDISSIQESDEYNATMLKKDKNYVPKYAVGSNTTGSFVEVVDMLGTIEELKLIELQDKYEKDVSQAFNSVIDPNTRRIEVDEDFIKDIQNDINSYILKELPKELGVDDWDIKLRSSRMSDEANELRLEGLKIQNATGRANLGFEITGYNKDTKEYLFENTPSQLPGQVNFSSFSSNSRGLENTFGNLDGTEDMKPKE